MNPTLLDSIQEIMDRADEAKKAHERTGDGNSLQFGRLLAFAEVLSILKSDFVGEEEIEKVLNFDIDRRYFGK